MRLAKRRTASSPAWRRDNSLCPLARSPSNTSRALCARLSATSPVSLTHLPLSWNGAWWPFRHPLDFLGSDGGGGLGAGPGVTVGAALALKGTGRIAVGICGDGDFLMGATALWTAAHYRIPLLIVVANNRSFYNDEVHQERVARMRNRPVENKWIGQRIVRSRYRHRGARARAGRGRLRTGRRRRETRLNLRRGHRGGGTAAASRSSTCVSRRAIRPR